jgi:hypothetical protein
VGNLGSGVSAKRYGTPRRQNDSREAKVEDGRYLDPLNPCHLNLYNCLSGIPAVQLGANGAWN